VLHPFHAAASVLLEREKVDGALRFAQNLLLLSERGID
jgi:hypothetical protein